MFNFYWYKVNVSRCKNFKNALLMSLVLSLFCRILVLNLLTNSVLSYYNVMEGEVVMKNLFQIGALTGADCGGLLPLVKVIRKGVFPIVQWLIPIFLMVYGLIDLFKAVISSDEKEEKAAKSKLIKRCIYAALIFFVAMLVTAIMGVISIGGEGDTNGWRACWEAANK